PHLTRSELHHAALRGDTSVAHLTVDWSHGRADYWTVWPLAQSMWSTSAVYAFGSTARPIPGHGPARWPPFFAGSPPPLNLAAVKRRAPGRGFSHPFAIRPVTDQCSQADVAIEDHPASWPLVQPRPGTPQPRTRFYVPGTPGERVGSGQG